MNIKIDKTNRLSMRDQIKEQIKGLAQAGQLKFGDQLPTIRRLSIELEVNFNTGAQAYRELTTEGVIKSERGKGTFVVITDGQLEREQKRIRKLDALVNGMFAETRRLGYSDEEVLVACRDYLQTK